MKLLKMFKRGQKGFTLVELMVVMAIMAVLATIVVPAVTGTKGPAESTQLLGDANAVQSAAAKFNNDSANATAPWPDAAIGTKYTTELSAVSTAEGVDVTTVTYTDSRGVQQKVYTEVNWDAATSVRLKDGSLHTVYFVPDYVPKAPSSEAALIGTGITPVVSAHGTVTGSGHVYVWLFKSGSGTDAPGRSVEVFKTNDGGLHYTKVN